MPIFAVMIFTLLDRYVLDIYNQSTTLLAMVQLHHIFKT